MVSITGVSAGQASHYYSKDNYYSKAEGEWQGKGAEELGLQGEVKKEDFEKLLNGQGPNNEFQIANGGENQNHRAALDLTFSAPKSVSVLSEVLGDDRIRDAHEKAVSEALRYVEQHYSQARQTNAGITEKVDTGNLVIAKFQHNTSRELDPQLHTHSVMMNVTQRPDGSWRALSNEEIYQNKMLTGQIYRNELAANLKDLGYSIQSDHKGLFEVQGIDQRLLDHFSQRKEQIDAKVKEFKESGQYQNVGEQKLREIATLGSRVAKQDVDMQTVKELWQERLKEHGYTKEQIQEQIKDASEKSKTAEQNRTEPKANEYDHIRSASRIITEQESTFSKEDILKTAGKLSVGEQRIGDLEKAFNEMNGDKQIIKLQENVYTTPKMQKIEKDIVQKVRDGQSKTPSIVTKEQAQQGLKEYEQKNNISLTAGQREAANHVLTSNDKYTLIQGDAGTGKTTMLKAVKDIAIVKGYHVKGLSLTGKAAEEIEKKSGIKSQTVDSFLGSRGTVSGGDKQLWIIDESSMLGSQKLHQLTSAADTAGAKMVFMGDTKQLQSIEAGKMFSKLQESGIKTVRMSDVIRQKTEEYKAIVNDLSEKKIDGALDKLESKNKVYESKDRQERLDAIVKDYTTYKNYRSSIIVTARNADRNELNSKIRKELKAHGKLGKDEHTFTVRESKNLSPADKHFAQSYKTGDRIIANKAGIIGRAGREGKVTSIDQQNHKITVQTKEGKEHTVGLKEQGQHLAVYQEKQQSFSQGDKVIFVKNDKSLNLKNGQTGEIKNIDKDGKAIIQMEKNRELKINIKTQYNYLDHGYAVTSYKAQGQTTQKVIYHADTSKEVNYNQAYVALTRGEQDVRIYTNSKSELREQMKHEQQKTSTLTYSEIEKSKVDREAITEIEKSSYKGAAKIEYVAEKMTDKIPVVKSLMRDIGKDKFNHGKAAGLMKEREKELKDHAKTGSAISKHRAEKIEEKVETEFTKMTPKERAQFEQVKKGKAKDKSKSDAGHSKSDNPQGKEVEKSK